MYINTPIEWTPSIYEHLLYEDQEPNSISTPTTKTAGLMSRAFNLAMKDPVMIGAGAYGRTRDKLYNINNNTMNYSLGKTF